MKIYDVPFVENPSGHCVPTCIAMVVQYFRPELNFDLKASDELCGYKDGLGTWSFKSALELREMGFDLAWIADWSIDKFADNPVGYLKELFQDEDALQYQLTKSDIPLEQERAKQFLKSRLPFTQRQGTKEDIISFLDKGWLVRCEVNGAPLSGKTGYDAHSVLAIGYSEDSIIIHNPDGKNGSKPNQEVKWADFLEAWKGFGGSMEMVAYFGGKQ